MPRIRYIKPEIGTDEHLAELSIPARYLFAILPTQCDKEGRMEDSPRRLKLATFPWDEVDVDALLSELSPRFVIRYEAQNKRILQVRGFKKHQRPHPGETPSELPPPPSEKIKFNDKKCKPIKKNGEMLIKGTGTGIGTGTGTGIAEPAAPPAPVIVKPKTPLQRIVEAYKVAKGVPMGDKGWDKANFARCAKAGKHLLACFDGDLEKSAAYLFLRSEEMNDKGLDWTLETISRHAWDGMGMPKEEGDGKQYRTVEPAGLPDARGHRRITPAGEIAGETLRAIEHAAIRAEGAVRLEADGVDSTEDHEPFE